MTDQDDKMRSAAREVYLRRKTKTPTPLTPEWFERKFGVNWFEYVRREATKVKEKCRQ